VKRVLVLFSFLFLATLSQLILNPTTSAQSANDPQLPQVLLDTTYMPPGGATVNVPAGGDLQAAINNARPGDTIVIQAGATYMTPPDGFVLPNKSGSGWLVIRTSNMSALPAEGTRVNPSNAAAMPKIVTPAVSPAVYTAAGAHHYRFIGIEFAVATGTPLNYNLIAFGDTNQASLDVVPHDLILDRCYLHGDSAGEMIRGVALNSARTAIIDSYLANFHSQNSDAQAICAWNGPGPFKIVNNFLEGTGENVLFGGSDPGIYNLVPSDIEFRRNYCAKRLSWKVDDPSYAGTRWGIKNLLELKNARRLLIDGNTFEYLWVAAQNGAAIVLTPRNQYGSAPWSCVQDVTFTNNIVRHAACGLLLLGWDYTNPSQQTQRVKIQNNLFDDIGGSRWGGTNVLYYLLDNTVYVTLDHNTAFQQGNIVTADGRPHTGFIYRNNLTPHNSYGIVGSGTAPGNGTLAAYFPGSLVTKNVFISGPASLYPAGNFFPATTADVGFVDFTGGNYRLASSSPYKGAGTDGRDVGADIDAIQAAMNGTPPPPSPPPSGNEVVLYAKDAAVRVGNWQVVSDSTAAGGARLRNPDAGAAKLTDALSNPGSYFELTFTAQAGVPYRLWLRGKADSDSPYNDSVFFQFSGSVDASANAVFRIGTTSSTVINLEDCSGCGLSGWGWQDNGWGIGVLGPLIYFQNSGAQTLRVQPREDGLSIDQIVLSSQTYLNTSPGALRNDTTILPPNGGSPPPTAAPTVTSVNPNSGTTVGGTAVTISGTNFVSGATVSFGGMAATNVTVSSSMAIIATTPTHAAGAVNVTVTNPDAQSASLANGFTYTTASTLPSFGHVFVVVEENHGYNSVIGSSAMPYLNTLASRYGLATSYYANTHPSIGNYFWMTTGQVITNDSNFTGTVTADNITRQLIAANKTWKAYAESLPSVGYTGTDQYPYVKRHNPFAYLSDVLNSTTQTNNLVPFSQFAGDVANFRAPNFSFIIPNQLNNAHDCPSGTSCADTDKLTAADNWLRTNIDPLIASPTFQQDGLLVIVFDESVDSDTTYGGGQVAMLVISPVARQNYQATTLYQHQSLLRLIAEGLGLTSYPGAASTAPNMAEFFGGSNAAPIPTTITPNSGTTAGGTVVTINGTGFVSGATVSFGGIPATNVTVVGSTTITATTPAHSAGAVNVTISNPNAQTGTLANGFTYSTSTPPPETVLLADDFNANVINTALWNTNNLYSGYTDSSVQVVDRNQRLEIGPLKSNTSGSHYNGIRSASAFDFTRAYAYVELVQTPAASTAADAMFTIGISADNYYRIYVESGSLICQKKINGAKTNLFTAPYDSTNHRFLQIRHDAAAGRVVFETASSVGSWTQRASQTWDNNVPLSSVIFELKAGTWQPEAVQPGSVYFDNFRAARP
jgi:hypothetical protein